jgi:DNA-binding CsgD family transcriptional regulator
MNGITASSGTTPTSLAQRDALVAALYAAAAGEGAWRDACDRLCAAFDLRSIQLLGVHTDTGAKAFSFEGGRIAPEAALLYVTDYHAINPRLSLARFLDDAAWAHDHEHFDDAFVASDRFYQEFLLPFGGRWMSVTRLLVDAGIVVFMCLHRSVSQRPLSAAELAAVDDLRPHVARALAMHARRVRTAAVGAAGHAVLDLLTHPAYVVDESMLVRHANAAGRALLDADGPLRVRDGYLDGATPVASRGLVASVHALGLGGALVGPDRPDRSASRLPACAGGPEHVVLAIAARPDATSGSFGDTPCAVLIVHPLTGGTKLDPLIVALAFDLTPAEAGAAIGIAAGETPERIAAQRGVTIHTVRAQLRSVFEKLDVGSQSELTARLLALPRLGAHVHADAGARRQA